MKRTEASNMFLAANNFLQPTSKVRVSIELLRWRGFRQRSLFDKPIVTNLLRVVNAIVHHLRSVIIGPVQHP